LGNRLERVDTYAGDWFEGSKNRGFLAFVSLIPGFGNTTTTQLTKTKLVLNHKSITPEDELADALEEMARDIALIEAIQDNLLFRFPPLN
jgi:hypothetical protein